MFTHRRKLLPYQNVDGFSIFPMPFGHKGFSLKKTEYFVAVFSLQIKV